MENLKHTKGEWECKLVNNNSSKYWWHIENYLGESICNTIDNSYESEVNAKLIAAAPELLEFIIHCVKNDCFKYGNEESAIQLINKATK